jgi:hypothetical protein
MYQWLKNKMKLLIKYYIPDPPTGGGDDGKTIKIKDGRKTDAITGKPVLDTNNLSHDADVPMMQKIILSAKKNGVDPYTALAIAHQETGLASEGDSEGNPFHLLDDKPADLVDSGMKTIKQKLQYAQSLGKKSEADQIQAFNGYGKVGQNTEGKQSSMYGVDVTKTPIDMNKTPLYGKRIIDIRDNILKTNPDVVNLVNNTKGEYIPNTTPSTGGRVGMQVQRFTEPMTNTQTGTQKNWNTGLQSANMLDNKNVNYANSPAVTGGDDPKTDAPKAPSNYKPLSVDERTQWNGFLDYLDKNKMGGNAALDKRDQSLGLNYFNKYKAANPNFTLNPDDVQRVQYDQYLLRKGDNFPTMKPEELAFVRNGLNPAYMKRDISQPDNWLGSLTSKEYYPQSMRLKPNGNVNFGTDIESYVKSLNNPDLEKNFPLIPK